MFMPLNRLIFLIACVIAACALTLAIGMYVAQIIQIPMAWLILLPVAMISYLVLTIINAGYDDDDDNDDEEEDQP